MKPLFLYRTALLIAATSFLSAGCSNLQGLLTLKRLGDNQATTQRYVEQQAKLFERLIADIKSGTIAQDLTFRQFVRSYGEPILSRPDEPCVGMTTYLFRHPTDFFKSDRVYATFDSTGALTQWDYKPYQGSQ